jgi:hypothetical protein
MQRLISDDKPFVVVSVMLSIAKHLPRSGYKVYRFFAILSMPKLI